MNTPHPTWRKSSRSDNNGGACVEVASLPSTAAVRDSKDHTGPVLTFTTTGWSAFIRAVKADGFNA
ncbi:DUF397 domain-containing protein [Micromonospora sp. LOL_013]|uniref:DUF397 domain-containing protein n=1 Tax=Micromonospora sp. LOL_013 TaxID=3345414 RepID=UPI003A89348F